MVTAPRRAAAVLALVAAVLVCRTSASRGEKPAGACGAVVDERQASLSREVVWVMRDSKGERRKLDAQCEAVGPIVLRDPPAHSSPHSPEDVAIVGWNVHVGGGDVVRLVRQLESGALTGKPVSHFVLVLQEAHRADGGLRELQQGVRVPRRIAPDTKGRTREDILSVAQALNIGLYYVPSMRNGAGPPFEDRGNAILSTCPLDDLLAIELPFARQRRVAIAATIRGVDRNARAWSLVVAAVHLDALAGASRLWIFASGWRARQARVVLEGLDRRDSSVLAGDLNTWFLGTAEGAYKRIERAYPDTRETPVPDGRTRHGRLDYLFFRLPPDTQSRTWRPADPCATGRQECGSDHRPIVATLTFAPGEPRWQ